MTETPDHDGRTALAQDLYADTLAATREITDPLTRFNRLLDVASYTRSTALIDEASDLAHSFDAPEERSVALFRVFRAATR